MTELNRKYLDMPGYGNLNPAFRYHVLLVAEGLKPMALNGDTDRQDAVAVLDAIGLPYEEIPMPEFTGFAVYGNEEIRGRYAELESRPYDWDVAIENGKLLGYPECCVEEYFGSVSPSWGNWLKEKLGMPVFKFEAQANRAARPVGNTGRFDEPDIPELYYTQHIPCDIECAPTMELGRRNRDVLETYDPEAARAMRMEAWGWARGRRIWNDFVIRTQVGVTC